MAISTGGSYVSVWNIIPNESGRSAAVLCSNSVKKRATGQYEEDFSGFITFIGDANEKIRQYPAVPTVDPESGKKRPIVRLHLTNVSITGGQNKKDESGYAVKNAEGKYEKYPYKFQCYEFEVADSGNAQPQTPQGSVAPTQTQDTRQQMLNSFMPIPDGIDEELPFN